MVTMRPEHVFQPLVELLAHAVLVWALHCQRRAFSPDDFG